MRILLFIVIILAIIGIGYLQDKKPLLIDRPDPEPASQIINVPEDVYPPNKEKFNTQEHVIVPQRTNKLKKLLTPENSIQAERAAKIASKQQKTGGNTATHANKNNTRNIAIDIKDNAAAKTNNNHMQYDDESHTQNLKGSTNAAEKSTPPTNKGSAAVQMREIQMPEFMEDSLEMPEIPRDSEVVIETAQPVDIQQETDTNNANNSAATAAQAGDAQNNLLLPDAVK